MSTYIQNTLDNFKKKRDTYDKVSMDFFNKLYKKSNNYKLTKNMAEVKHIDEYADRIRINFQYWAYIIVYEETYKNKKIKFAIPIIEDGTKGICLVVPSEIVYQNTWSSHKPNKQYVNANLANDKIISYVNILKREVDSKQFLVELNKLIKSKINEELPKYFNLNSQPIQIKLKSDVINYAHYSNNIDFNIPNLKIGDIIFYNNGFIGSLVIDNVNYIKELNDVNIDKINLKDIKFNIDHLSYNDRELFMRGIMNNVDDFMNKIMNFDINYNKIKPN